MFVKSNTYHSNNAVDITCNCIVPHFSGFFLQHYTLEYHLNQEQITSLVQLWFLGETQINNPTEDVSRASDMNV